VSGFELAVVAGAVFVAALVQVLSGFGFALLSVPMMTLAVDVKEAVVISTLMGMSMSSWQAWHGRAHTDRAAARHMVIGAYLGMPFGLVYLTVDDHVLKVPARHRRARRHRGAARDPIDLRHVRPGPRHGSRVPERGAQHLAVHQRPAAGVRLQARHLAPDEFRATINTRVRAAATSSACRCSCSTAR
jgi:hypothetical protein